MTDYSEFFTKKREGVASNYSEFFTSKEEKPSFLSSFAGGIKGALEKTEPYVANILDLLEPRHVNIPGRKPVPPLGFDITQPYHTLGLEPVYYKTEGEDRRQMTLRQQVLQTLGKGLKDWRRATEATQVKGIKPYSLKELDVILGNIRKQALGVPRFPVDIAQQIFYDEEGKPHSPVEVGKAVVKTGGGFLEYGRQNFENYVTYINPLSSPEARSRAIENIAEDPLGLLFCTALVKGGVKGATKVRSIVKRVKKQKGLSVEEPPEIAKREAPTTEEPSIGKLQALQSELLEKAQKPSKAKLELVKRKKKAKAVKKSMKIPTRAKVKESWEMTKWEFFKKQGLTDRDYLKGKRTQKFDKTEAWHKNIVKTAIKEGKPVPKEVLAEYPGLKGKVKPSVAEVKPGELVVSRDFNTGETVVFNKKDMRIVKSPLGRDAWLGKKRILHPKTEGQLIAKIAKLKRQRKEFKQPDFMKTAYKLTQEELRAIRKAKASKLRLERKRMEVALAEKAKPEKLKTAEDFLTNAEKKARERIKKRGLRLTAGIDPAEMADYAIIGAAKIAKGTIKFADWSVEMVKEFGERTKPYLKTIYAQAQKKIPRLKANAELDSFINYFENIQAPKGFRPPKKPVRSVIKERLHEEGLKGKELILATDTEFIEAVHDYGIALRQTKTGKIQPAIRVAGTYVPEDFTTYTKFKDARAGALGGTKDVTRFIQEIDGALPAEVKAKLPGQAGPAERYVMWRTRDMMKSRIAWTRAMKSHLATMTQGLSKKQNKIANRVIEYISRKGAYVNPAKLVTNPKISAITTDLDIIRFAQESRKLYESLLRHQNEARRLRGQEEIPHRDYYTPHSIHETTIWGRALGYGKTPERAIGPSLPDYIKPNAPFNARAMARELGLPETVREMNLSVLLEHYIGTAAKDIFNTSIVQNNKAFIQQLKSLGYEHAARGLENWTAEAFTGIKGAVDRTAGLSRTIHKGMSLYRQGLLRSVFPLNFAWNTFVQTSSGVLTVTRYGARNSIKGLYDWFGSRRIRKDIRDNAYSAIVKSQRSGRISRQDINRGVGVAERLNRGKLEKASDAANFFTEWVERHLTGWSVATARRHGAEVGLKGKTLWEYASDGGAKTQSMYNLEDLPGILRSEIVKTGSPFQTFSFEIFNTLREFAGKTGTPPATTAIRIKWVLRFLAGVTAVNYIGKATIGRKPWELSSFIPFYGTLIAPVSAAIRGGDVSQATTRGLPSPIGIAMKGGRAVRKGLITPGFAATKEFVRTGDFRAALKEFMATGKWDELRRFTIRYLGGFVGIPGGTQTNRIVDGLIATSEGGMVDSSNRMMFPITDTKDKIRSFLAGPWASKGGQDYWDKRGGKLNLDIEFMEDHPLLRDVTESIPVASDLYKFGKASKSQTQQSIWRMIRTGNLKDARYKRLKWNVENPNNKITKGWMNKQISDNRKSSK